MGNPATDGNVTVALQELTKQTVSAMQLKPYYIWMHPGGWAAAQKLGMDALSAYITQHNPQKLAGAPYETAVHEPESEFWASLPAPPRCLSLAAPVSLPLSLSLSLSLSLAASVSTLPLAASPSLPYVCTSPSLPYVSVCLCVPPSYLSLLYWSCRLYRCMCARLRWQWLIHVWSSYLNGALWWGVCGGCAGCS